MRGKRKPGARRTPIVVIGGGGHAKVILGLLSQLRNFEVLGYVDPRDNGDVLGHPRLGGHEALASIAKKKGAAAVIGFGRVKGGGRSRMTVVDELRNLGFVLPVLIAPSAVVASDVSIGEATVVMEGAVVQPGSAIGIAGIINTGSIIEHDCVIGNDVHVAPGAVLSGNVRVGDNAMIGAGSCLVQGVRVAPDCSVGAGAAVTSDCLVSGTYVGVPARRIES